MDVVGHQAIAPDLNAGRTAALAEELAIGAVVVVAEEHLLTPVAPLGDEVRLPFDHHPSQSRHELMLGSNSV